MIYMMDQKYMYMNYNNHNLKVNYKNPKQLMITIHLELVEIESTHLIF